MMTEPLLPVVLDLVVKATAVLTVAALAASALRRRPAAERHLVWAAALAALVALPLATGVAPAWELPGPRISIDGVPSAGVEVGEARPSSASGTAGSESRASDGSAEVRVGASATLGETGGGGSEGAGVRAASWLMGIWAGGAALVLAYLALAFMGSRRVVRASHPCTDPRIVSLAERLVATVGLRRAPRILLTDELSVPAAAGLVCPAVLLPADAPEWSDERLRSVLLHELAHVRRRDLVGQVLARLSCALYWPHPGVWMAARRLHSERERACDDIVLAAGTEPTTYASCLLDLARTAREGNRVPAAAVSMARPRELEGRLLAVLNGEERTKAVSRFACAVTATLTLLVTLPLAGAHLPTGPDETAPEPGQPATADEAGSSAGTRVWMRPAPNDPDADPDFRSLAGQRSRFLAETRALVVPVLREALGEDPLVTDAVLDGIATAAAYPLWRTLDVRITVPDHFETGQVKAWAEGDSHLSIVRGPVERIEVVVSTRMGPLPESLPERVRGNLAASGHRVTATDEPAMEAGLRAAGAELERRWATILREEGTR